MFGPASTILPPGTRPLMRNAAFREAYREASDFVEERRGWSMWNEIHNDQPPPGVTVSERNFVEEVVFQMCLFRALKETEVKFDAVAGMSLGDAAAGYASGAITFAEALHVLCETIRAVLCAGGGDLVLVQAPPARVLEVIRDPDVTIVFEWSQVTVWAVPHEAARQAQRRLRAAGIAYIRLGFDCLSHTYRVDVAGLHRAFAEMPERHPEYRLYSTLEGGLVDDPAPRGHWARAIAEPASLEKMWRRMREDRFTDIIYVGSVAADRDLFASLPPDEKPTSYRTAESFLSVDESFDIAAIHGSTPGVADIATAWRSSAFARDPYPFYHRWLAASPVHKLPDENFFVVLGYEEALSVVKQPTIFSSSPFESLSPVLPGADAPLHTRVRRVLAPYYTKEQIYARRNAVAEITSAALSAINNRPSFDAVAELTVAVPFAVSCSLLGLTQTGAAALGPILPHDVTWPDVERALTGDGIIPDVVAKGEMPREELMLLLPFLIGAGVLTVRDLLSFGIYTLFRHPDLLAEMRTNPSMVPAFVEELLRFEPAIHGVPRRATSAAKIGSVDVPEGSTIWVWLGAANRDPAHFDRPNEFIIGREKERHIAFGAGPHFCLGSHLGRLEAEVVIESLLPHLGRLRATAAPDFSFNDLRGGYPVYPLMRSMRSWQLAFTSR